VTRHVRTAAGEKKYGLPIGSPIVPGAARAKMAAGEAAKKVTPGPATKPTSPPKGDMARWESMTAAQLRAEGKAAGLGSQSKASKTQLVEALRYHQELHAHNSWAKFGAAEHMDEIRARPAPPRAAKAPISAVERDRQRAALAEAEARQAAAPPRQSAWPALMSGDSEKATAAASKVGQAPETPSRPQSQSVPDGTRRTLERMVGARDSRQAWELADGLKGRELDAALAAIPASHSASLTKSAKVDAKRRALVAWATSASVVNAEAIRSTASGSSDAGHMQRVRDAERHRRLAEIGTGSATKRPRARDLMTAPTRGARASR
jgi:hypothetical protein